MSNSLHEYESRLMISEEQYFNIVSFYLSKRPYEKFIQNTNIYFETEDLALRREHIVLRVRIINDNYVELTLKEKAQEGDIEINDTLNGNQIEQLQEGYFPDGEVKNRLSLLACPLSSIKQVAKLNNRRLEIKEEDHLLVIDKNTYGDITDYNIEVEADNMKAAKDILIRYIEKFNLQNNDKKYAGKARRAIDEALKNKD